MSNLLVDNNIGSEGGSPVLKLPPVLIESPQHRCFFVDTMKRAACRYIDGQHYTASDLETNGSYDGQESELYNQETEFVGSTTMSERTSDNIKPDSLLCNADLEILLNNFYDMAMQLPIGVRNRLFTEIITSQEEAFYYTSQSDSDIKSLGLNLNGSIPIQFDVYMEGNCVGISHLSYMDLNCKQEEKRQYGLLYTAFPIHAGACAEIIYGLIPDCRVLELYDERGFSVQIKIGEGVEDAIEYILDYTNTNAIDGLLYSATFDLNELQQ